MDERFKTKLYVVLHGNVNWEVYSEDEPEKVKEQLGGTCLWVHDADGMDVQLNLREIPMIGVMSCE